MSRPLLTNVDPVLRRVRAAGRVLLALDFDGTLAPIAPRPEEAVLPPATARRLAALTGRDAVSLALVSGRPLADLRRRVELPCMLAGNHGLEIEGPGISFVHPEAALLRPALFCACNDVESALAGIDGAFVERKGLSATIHYRLTPPESHCSLRAAVAQAMRPYAARLNLLPALKAWEIRPRVGWDKGNALRFILEHMGGEPPLVIVAGDDAGDEPMFEAVPGDITISVGDGAGTSARYSVASPAELAVFLGQLAG